jgi:hypothetical protein
MPAAGLKVELRTDLVEPAHVVVTSIHGWDFENR